MNAPATAPVSETDLLPGYISREALARKLGISVRTLDRWHTQRSGPPRISPIRPGASRSGLILYKVSEVERWLDSLATTPVRPSRRRLGRAA
jgi:transcriptional regulator with XRE-family HTH domain